MRIFAFLFIVLMTSQAQAQSSGGLANLFTNATNMNVTISGVTDKLGNWLSAFPSSNITQSNPISVTGTTDTLASTDCARTVIYKNQDGVAVSLPALGSGCGLTLRDEGAGDVTVTPAVRVANMAAPFTIRQNDACQLSSNGSTYDLHVCPIFDYNPTFSTGDMTVADGRLLITNTSTIQCSYIDSSGNIAFTAAGSCAGRVDYNPNGLALRGVAKEPTRTNYMARSSLNSGWTTQNGAAFTAGTTILGYPSRTFSYTSTAGSGIYKATATLTDSVTYAATTIIKNVSGDNIRFGFEGNWTGGTTAQVNITPSTCTYNASIGTGVLSYSVGIYGDGCKVTVRATKNTTGPGTVTLYRATAGGELGVLYVQVEESPTGEPQSTSYINSDATVLTRNKDSWSYITPYWLKDTKGSLRIDFTTIVNTSGMRIVSDGAADRNMLYFATATSAGSLDGTNSADYDIAFQAAGTENKVAVVYGDTASVAFLNGVKGTPATFDGDYGIGDLKFFSDHARTNNAYGWIKNVEWRSYEMTDAEAIAETAP